MSDTITAAALIGDGMCSPACLLATQKEAVACSCPCDGAYHATLAGLTIALAPGHTRRATTDASLGQLTLDLETVA